MLKVEVANIAGHCVEIRDVLGQSRAPQLGTARRVCQYVYGRMHACKCF